MPRPTLIHLLRRAGRDHRSFALGNSPMKALNRLRSSATLPFAFACLPFRPFTSSFDRVSTDCELANPRRNWEAEEGANAVAPFYPFNSD
jgi:hypothetical protein